MIEDIECDIDCYDILKISETATNKEINSAYRALVKKMHPDVTGKSATEEFINIQKAYNILNDSKKRQAYDSIINESTINETVDDLNLHAFNAGSNMFSDTNMFGDQKKSKSICLILDVDLEEIYEKKTKLLKINKDSPCEKCKGEKIDIVKIRYYSSIGNDFRCANCKGIGKVFMIQMSGHARLEIPVVCPQCQGERVIIRPEVMCDVCDGTGIKNVLDAVEIKLSHSIVHGTKLQMDGIGNQLTVFHEPGSVIIHINELNHKNFRRSKDGKDLLFVYKIPLFDALGCTARCIDLGRTINIKTLSGETIIINIPHKKIIKPGEVKKILGKGMPLVDKNNNTSFGDMYILFEIIFPDTLDSGLTAQGLTLSFDEMEKISYPSGFFGRKQTEHKDVEFLDYSILENIDMSSIHPNFSQKKKINLTDMNDIRDMDDDFSCHTSQCPIM